jgi:SHS2 domain-containing protein
MWRTVDHTADALLVVEAPTWSDLLAEAVTAFCGWIAAGVSPSAVREERVIAVTGADATETWVMLWRTLHRLWVVEGWFAVAGRAHPGATPLHSEVTVECVPVAALAPAQLVDVKAVTWHEASAAPTTGDHPDGPWRGTIVLDI